MKIVFMGTPEFAVPILDEIRKKHEVILVVSQPNTYNYRKKTYVLTPISEYAQNHGLRIIQPNKIKEIEKDILSLDVDLIVTAAYGQFISKTILDHPKYKSINVHGSILPKYRGGAPIQRAIMGGEDETGITIMYMSKKMDAGDILKIEKIPILDSDNQMTIFKKLSLLGSKMINSVIDELKNNKIIAIPQDEEKATYAPNLTKEDELIDFTKSNLQVFNKIRGLNPNPGAYFILDGLNIKVYDSRVGSGEVVNPPGTIIDIKKDCFQISCGEGTIIEILEIQIPSKKRMNVRDFLNGTGKTIVKLYKEVNL